MASSSAWAGDAGVCVRKKTARGSKVTDKTKTSVVPAVSNLHFPKKNVDVSDSNVHVTSHYIQTYVAQLGTSMLLLKNIGPPPVTAILQKRRQVTDKQEKHAVANECDSDMLTLAGGTAVSSSGTVGGGDKRRDTLGELQVYTS